MAFHWHPLVFAMAAAMFVGLAGCGESEPQIPSQASQTDNRVANAESGDDEAIISVEVPDESAREMESETPIVEAATPASTDPAIDAEAFDASLASIRTLVNATQFREARVALLKLRDVSSFDEPQRLALRELEFEIRQHMNSSVGLAHAIEALGGDRADLRTVASAKLLNAGDTGKLFLRHAVLTRSDAAAVEAVSLLVRARDEQRVALFASRISEAPPAMRAAMYQNLGPLDDDALPEAVVRQAAADLKSDDDALRRGGAELLANVYANRAGGDAKRFTAMVADDAVLTTLRDELNTVLASSTPADRAWAERYVALLNLYMPGLHGEYYAGTSFDKLVMHRLDERINISDQSKYGFPDDRQTELSIRWTGFVMIPRAGEYTFVLASDDGQRMWVGDKMIVDDWNAHGVEERVGRIELAEGMHPIRIEHFQGGGGGAFMVRWEGPGIERQFLTSEYTRSKPHPELKSGP